MKEGMFLTLFQLFYRVEYTYYSTNPIKKGKRNFVPVHDLVQNMYYFLKIFLSTFPNYSFLWNWSPYSYSLFQHLQSLDEKIKNGADIDNVNLPEKYVKDVIQVRKNLQVLSHGLDVSTVEWMEIVSCLDYIKRFELPLSKLDKVQVELLQRKPYFHHEHVSKAWRVLEECKEIYR
ncbi:MAG: hypothetical protein ACOX0R_02120 [Candidatus Dojkabacteria bacterium]|jgi:hypothetical protein